MERDVLVYENNIGEKVSFYWETTPGGYLLKLGGVTLAKCTSMEQLLNAVSVVTRLFGMRDLGISPVECRLL